MSKPKKTRGRSLNGNTAWPVIPDDSFTMRPTDEAWRVWEHLQAGVKDERTGKPHLSRASYAATTWEWLWAYSNKPGPRDLGARGLMRVDLDELERRLGRKGARREHSHRALADLDSLRLISYERDRQSPGHGVVFFPALHVVSFDSPNAPEPFQITVRDDLAPVRAYNGFTSVHDTSWEEFAAAHHRVGYASFSRKSMSKRSDQEFELISWLAHMRTILGMSPGPRSDYLCCSSYETMEEMRDQMYVWVYGVALDRIHYDVLHWDTFIDVQNGCAEWDKLIDWEPNYEPEDLRRDSNGRPYVRFMAGEKRMKLFVRSRDVSLFTEAA